MKTLQGDPFDAGNETSLSRRANIDVRCRGGN